MILSSTIRFPQVRVLQRVDRQQARPECQRRPRAVARRHRIRVPQPLGRLPRANIRAPPVLPTPIFISARLSFYSSTLPYSSCTVNNKSINQYCHCVISIVVCYFFKSCEAIFILVLHILFFLYLIIYIIFCFYSLWRYKVIKNKKKIHQYLIFIFLVFF